MRYFRSPIRAFDADRLRNAKMTCEVIWAILVSGPNGAVMKNVSLAVHGKNREGTTNAYLSYDLPRQGVQAVRLDNGRVTIVPTNQYTIEELRKLVEEVVWTKTATKAGLK